ncbi:alkaline phosphatase family protein [Cohnella xylanilytica]|uniref:Alkaline phosphatase family protein n=1 Tax=Cohnella xylanilytica TaxID=557555 RepID=A0A841U7C8_9BACL|nr:alkaline phosphatase family protein [Cohnella xylanilytica]MBB6695759.1 alkaline phosphatase family protein [Cohnella xylanilytica]
MRRASSFEIVAARAWNVLNEGRPFTPVFVAGVFLLCHIGDWGQPAYWSAMAGALGAVLPLFVVYFFYDFPLYLRNYLWLPVVAAVVIWEGTRDVLGLWLAGIGLFFFFTVFFWGTFYYRMRIGTPWNNFARFWKLVLQHSDSTSGNAQEQLPKTMLLLYLLHLTYGWIRGGGAKAADWGTLYVFIAAVWLLAWILHRYLFDWKPKERTESPGTLPRVGEAVSRKVYVLVVDGMRKERFEQANAPFLKKLRAEGTEFTSMETVYPARTVVCFSSMFTGAYPREHGIKSNFVYRLGVRTETIFDSLRKVGKTGRLLGIAHLIDSMGDDVDAITAVMRHDRADAETVEMAKRIVEERNPDLMVVQLIGTDQIGHSRGVFYDDYIEKIEEADRLLENFVGWLSERGLLEEATMIVCADHGQAIGIGGHGHLDEGERFVPFFLAGHGIRRGVRVDAPHSLVSMAPTLAYLLGAPYPDHSRGPVLTEALESFGDRSAAIEKKEGYGSS